MSGGHNRRQSAHDRFAVIEKVPTRGVCERAVLLAALYWANDAGELWPAVARWAKMAGVSVRTLQRSLRRLVDRGILRVSRQSLGGPRGTSRYQIVGLTNPDSVTGFQPRHPRPETLTSTSSNPVTRAPKPCQRDGGTTKNNHENNQQQAAAADVFERLGIQDLRGHPNATPERVAWIEREAASKQSPGGWAAKCIRGAWPLPTVVSVDPDAEAQRKRRWVVKLHAEKARQAPMLAEFIADKAAGRVTDSTTFGDWAWNRYGAGEAP